MKSTGLKPTKQVLAVNGGSSSIKFALFQIGSPLRRHSYGAITGIGSPKATFAVKGRDDGQDSSRQMDATTYPTAVEALMDWLQETLSQKELAAVGHRIVHGGPNYWRPQRITAAMLAELRQISPFDPEHLPGEIFLAKAIFRRFPDVPQIASFDTAFHHDLPRIAQLLPIPRRYEAKGVRRYGFHGLSYAYLMEELERRAGENIARGKIVLAHLGSGASLAAIDRGKPIDTSMAFTPAAGVPMSTRSGDIDPGLAWYFAETEHIAAKQFNEIVNQKSGLLGMSETSSDLQELLARESTDPRAREAIDVFCYSIKKWIGAFAAALGGLDTLVFAGGIGEHAPVIRQRICEGLQFFGIELDLKRNAKNEPLISIDAGRVSIHVIPTDEEIMIARSTLRALGLEKPNEP